MKRRAFLQRSGLVMTALGASQSSIFWLADRYRSAVAEPTQRKLALLVGINQYRDAALYGSVTDVEMQRELLVHRFGFHPADVLVLTDQQATRTAIETAFQTHLIDQARSGDVVVFHFSGYGGTVRTDNSTQLSLVPIDELTTEAESLIGGDILAETLQLLTRSLSTSKLLTVLDTSHVYSGKTLQGTLRIRARPLTSAVLPHPAELALQEQLRSRVPLQERRQTQTPWDGVPGMVLAAAQSSQFAAETRWNGFSAGMFTYALTQHLWQTVAPTTLRTVFSQVREQVERLTQQEQHPALLGQNQNQNFAPFYTPLIVKAGADGVVLGTEEDGKTVRIWLGGLRGAVLEQSAGSWFTVADDAGNPIASLQLLARDGLTAKMKLRSDVAQEPIQAGQFVHEKVRSLPRSVGLAVALDSSLERIERVDAISALSAVPRVSVAIAGEQPADCLFSKIQPDAPTQVAALPNANLPGIVAASSYGLLASAEGVLPNTVGEGGEAIKVAVRRLVPRLQTLLAAKLLNLTVNESSSQLPLRATLERLAPQATPLLRRGTPAGSATSTKPSTDVAEDVPQVAAGDRLQIRLENRSPEPLYFVLVGMDGDGNLFAMHRASAKPSTAPPGGMVESVAAAEAIALPPADVLPWVARRTAGLAQAYVIGSPAPFTQTQALLDASLRSSGNAPAVAPVTNPLEVAQAVLQDLHHASAALTQGANLLPDTVAFDVSAWASLRFLYRVV